MDTIKRLLIFPKYGFILSVSLLFACVSAPYQSMSEAKQAFASAAHYLSQQPHINSLDQTDYHIAKISIEKAEIAIKQQQFNQADRLFKTGKQHSQAILKRRLPSKTKTSNNIKFRY